MRTRRLAVSAKNLMHPAGHLGRSRKVATIRIHWCTEGLCAAPAAYESRLRAHAKPGSDMVPSRPEAWSRGISPRSANTAVSENVQHEMVLLERIARQESEALAELYDRLAPALFGLACRMLNNEAEAEDVLQEVFLKVWERAVCYDSRLGTPMAWLITLTRNRANDRLRTVTRRSRILELVSQDDEASHRQEPPNPTGSAIARETVTAMQEALKQLPSDQRQAIEMAFLGGLSQSEIAAELKQPLGTIKARIRRGMLSLRDHLPSEWQANGKGSTSAKGMRQSGLDHEPAT